MSDYSPPVVETPVQAASNVLEPVLSFAKHPSVHATGGLALAALSQFTALVPQADRGQNTLIGLGYALAVLILDRFSPKS